MIIFIQPGLRSGPYRIVKYQGADLLRLKTVIQLLMSD
ncbi:hypothetical protein LPE509_02535 [Legionella pneumophila subsp. pneumophila LPE509]|nr:hypothetical protein LPE509_02535 [Legionella pneumophila subsp. pneumophila LPE509]